MNINCKLKVETVLSMQRLPQIDRQVCTIPLSTWGAGTKLFTTDITTIITIITMILLLILLGGLVVVLVTAAVEIVVSLVIVKVVRIVYICIETAAINHIYTCK